MNERWWVFRLWLATRVALFLVGLAALPTGEPGGVLAMFSRFDSVQYLRIAAEGYQPSFMGAQGWFPGYPLLIRWLSLGGPYLPVAALLSHLGLLGAMYSLLALWKLDYDSDTARAALLLLVLFPSAFFFSAVYTESLFLLLYSSSLLAARSGKWWVSGLLAAACSLTRPMGLLLVPVLIWEYRQSSQRSWGLGWLVLAPLLVAGFFYHLQLRLGNFWAYLQMQSQLGRKMGAWRPLLGQSEWRIEHYLGIAAGLLSVYLLRLAWSKMRLSDRFYVCVSILLPFANALWTSQPRYMLVLYPLFLGLRTRLSEPRWRLLLGLSFGLQLWAFFGFVSGSEVLF